MHTVRVVVLVAVVAGGLAAQTTWIVSAAGNGNFLDLPPAVAASRSGDRILVRPGLYTGPVITHSLSVVGTVGVTVSNAPCVVQGVPLGETVELTRLVFRDGLLLESCVGEVHLESCEVVGVSNTPGRWLGGTGGIIDCRRVTLNQCRFVPVAYGTGLTIQDSDVSGVLVSSIGSNGISGMHYGGIGGAVGLDIQSSTCHLVNPVLDGGDGAWTTGWWGEPIPLPGAPSLLARSSSVVITGDARASFTAGVASLIAMTGGSLVYDPMTGLAPYLINGTGTVRSASLPFVHAFGSPFGPVLVAEVGARIGSVSALLVGAPCRSPNP